MTRFFKTGCILVTALAFLLVGGSRSTAEEATAGKQTAHEFVFKTGSGDDAKEVKVRYWLFLPENYQEDRPVPLMLFLHGAGERGEELELVKKWGPPKLVEKDTKFPFLVVSPQCPKKQRWDVEQMVALVKDVTATYRVDQSRMYCTGLSMGGYGTWAIAAKYPQLFAAVVPICGGGDPAKAKALVKLPIWVFHGDKDKSVPLDRSKKMVDAIREAGGNVKFRIYPDVGHNSWSLTYGDPDVYKWLLSHVKK